MLLIVVSTTIIITIADLPTSDCAALNCSTPFNCGKLINLSYPFWRTRRSPSCGHPDFQLSCEPKQYPLFTIGGDVPQKFIVLGVDQSNSTMTLAHEDLWNEPCSSSTYNSSLDQFDHDQGSSHSLRYAANTRNLSIFYNCREDQVGANPHNFSCAKTDGVSLISFYLEETAALVDHDLKSCVDVVRVQVAEDGLDEKEGGIEGLKRALERGFDVEYMVNDDKCKRCRESGGTCGSDPSLDFSCICNDNYNNNQPSQTDCYAVGQAGSSQTRAILLVTGLITTGIVALVIGYIILCFRGTFSRLISTKLGWVRKSDKYLEDCIRNNGHLAIKRYSFSDVKKMTNTFKDKLGEGGYGSVFKGNLMDGSLVAVKLLNKSKGKGEEFINEVMSISRTSHVNIVTLLGFCLEGPNKALVYEFMPNGSLDKYIYNQQSQASELLGWKSLLEIAVGVARGLEYLHRGCNTRILHFDIKPHNILLDENFCPKISDFGLAKLFLKKDQSSISMLDARGTIGYIAPEVFNRNFGPVSHKSDVYSYGMLLLEIVCGRKNIKREGEGTSEMSSYYIPHLVLYEQLELGGANTDDEATEGVTEMENDIVKRMVLVGLWCIQTIPMDRPSMSRVIEMLEGSIEGLQIPPRPYIHSPSRTKAHFSITSSTCD